MKMVQYDSQGGNEGEKIKEKLMKAYVDLSKRMCHGSKRDRKRSRFHQKNYLIKKINIGGVSFLKKKKKNAC